MLRLTTKFLAFAWLAAIAFAASGPVKNLNVSLRGKQYEISDVATVEELQERVGDASGILAPDQGSVLFGGKSLGPKDVLRDVGVSDGADLDFVSDKASVEASTESVSDSAAMMEDYLKKAGVDGDKLEALMENMKGADGKVPSMDDSMKAMNEMMSSPIFQEYMNDPDKLEESRQMILNNPMLKSMMAGMPGMGEVLNNKDAWRETMQAAANMYKNMDPEMLKQAMDGMAGMGGGMGGLGGMGAGLGDLGNMFGGTLDDSAATAALDELDEDD